MRSLDCIRYALWSLLFCIGLVQLTSCGEDDGSQTNSNGQVLAYLYDVEEQDTTSTKAPKSTWSTGDAIGVYCVEPGKSLGQVNYASNCKYVYDGSKFKPATTDDNIWISRQGSFKFYAYYPYDASKTGANATALEFTLKTDQSVEANRVASDIIAGQSYTADNTTGEVNMIFYHMMSDVRFVWTRDDAENGEYVRALFAPKAIVNLDQLTSAPAPGQSVGTGIRMNVKTPFNAVAGSTEYQVYVPPTNITHNQDIFVPYDASDSKLSSVKANIGSAGSTKQLERGKTYDLAGTMYTITADVRRNGDLVSDQCDDFDGCVVNTSGGGDAGNLKKFVGRYLTGRTCTVTAEIASGVVSGTQFIGWFEYDRTTDTWTKVPGASETYTFDVTKNRRLQARYENYVFGNWVMSWTHSGVTKDGSGNFTTTIANTGTASSGLTLVPKATRTVTLDGENVTDPAFTTREGSQIKLAVTSQTPTTDMWNVNPWTYAEASKNLKVTPNIDFTDNGTSGTPKERNLVLSVTLLEGGTNYNATTKKYDDVTLSGNGGNMKVVQSKGTMSYSSWKVEATPANNTNMLANGTTSATVEAYAYRDWSLSGQVVKRETTSLVTNITGAFTTTDSHWTITADNTGLTKTVTVDGHEFTMRNGRKFTIKAANNESLNTRNITARFTSNSVSSDVAFSQQAGTKTNRSYTDWSIALTASPTELEPYASSGNTNTSVITTSATRTMTYKWNGTGDNKTENQTDGGSYNYGGGSSGTFPKVSIAVTPEKAGQFTASGSETGARVSVSQNYELKKTTQATTATVTATIANTEMGSAASTKTVTLTQKGGTYTETFDGWDTPTITLGGNIDGDGGSTTFSVTAPSGWIRGYINGDHITSADYKISAKWTNTSISNNSGVFSIDNASSGSVTAGANHGSQTPRYGSWTGGSVSVAKNSFGRSGGTTTISWKNPTRSKWEEYNTNSRSETITMTFGLPDTHAGASYVTAPPTATKTVTQNGSSSKVPNTDATETESNPSLSVSVSSYGSISGTTLTVNNATSTYKSYSIGSDGSVTASEVPKTGGTISYSTSKPTCTWTEYYNSVNRSFNVQASWSTSSISKNTAISQTADGSATGSSGNGTATASVYSWPSMANYSGYVGENPNTTRRSGTLKIEFSYEGKVSYATCTVYQAASTISYTYSITSASIGNLTWDYNKTDYKQVTATGTVTIYKSVNGRTATSDGTLSGCTFTVSGVSVSGSNFTVNGTNVKPSGANTTSSDKTGTISATVKATKSGYTISGSKSVTATAKQTYKLFTVNP